MKLTGRVPSISNTIGSVSIPKRVSEALKQSNSKIMLSSKDVSIPKRVSEALKLTGAVTGYYISKFQSLKGFQRL